MPSPSSTKQEIRGRKAETGDPLDQHHPVLPGRRRRRLRAATCPPTPPPKTTTVRLAMSHLLRSDDLGSPGRPLGQLLLGRAANPLGEEVDGDIARLEAAAAIAHLGPLGGVGTDHPLQVVVAVGRRLPRYRAGPASRIRKMRTWIPSCPARLLASR